MTVEPLKPNSQLLIKLGSIIIHYQEFLSPGGHQFDKTTAETLLENEDVKEWIKGMNDLALLPQKR